MKWIALNNRTFSCVDDDDWISVRDILWFRHVSGYARHGCADRIFLHHAILPPKEGLFTDHFNLDRTDNRRINLRLATPQQNIANSSRAGDVTFRTEQNRWRARMNIDGRRVSLGQFGSEKEAWAVFIEAHVEKFGAYSFFWPDKPSLPSPSEKEKEEALLFRDALRFRVYSKNNRQTYHLRAPAMRAGHKLKYE